MPILLMILLLLLLAPGVVAAQDAAPCDLVDAIDYPLDDLADGYDDFALYRARFEGVHVAIDIGFDRWGDPVRAAANGVVTYADTAGWDSEKGVVIVKHTFPDDSSAYTVYGHMEASDVIGFPEVGACVTQNSILGGIGWPSRGRPHLHYEIRNFMPDEGGPGYVDGNPLDAGWYHPLDFTQLWQLKLAPGFVSSTTFHTIPTLPPVMLDSGGYALASGNVIEGGAQQDGSVLWRVETDGIITGLAGLTDDRVVAHTRSGQVVMLQGGRYAALWQVAGIDEPFAALGETLIFAMRGGGLEAWDPMGKALWSLAPVSSAARVTHFETNGQQVAIGVRANEGGVVWRLVNGSGQVSFEATFDRQPVVAPVWDGSWVGLDGAQFKRFVNGENHSYNRISITPGRTASATVDLLGNSYVYMADVDHSLLALNPEGEVLWQTDYPTSSLTLPPLMDTGNGCMLYTLDMDGSLNVFSAASGDLVAQVKLYAGGERNRSPRARFLTVDQNERIRVGGGFLSLVTLDGWALGGAAMDSCLLG